MRWNKNILGVSAVIGVLISGQHVALAQTLEESLTNAFRHDPDFAAVRYGLAAARQKKTQSIIDFGPRFSFSYSSSDIDAEITPAGTATSVNAYDSNQQSFSVVQNILNGGVSAGTYQINKFDYDIAHQQFIQAEAEVLRGAAQSHTELYNAYLEVTLREKNVESLRQNLKAIRARLRAGDARRLDVTQAQAELGRAEAQLISRNAHLESTQAIYRANTGLEAEQLQEPKFDLILPATLEEARETMLAYHPEWKIAQLERGKLKKLKDISKLTLLPELNITGSKTVSENLLGNSENTDTQVLSLNLVYNIRPFRSFSIFKELNARLRQALESERRVGSDLEQRLLSVWGNLNAASAEKKASIDALNAGRQVFKALQREYQAGARSFIDLLDAEEELLDDELASIDAERRFINLQFDLLALTGQLNARFLGLDVE